MAVFKQEKMAKLRLPFCIDFKRTCVKDVTPSTKPIAPAILSTDRRTIFIDFDMIHNPASNKSFRMRKSYIPQGARAENMFFMNYLLRDSERKFVRNNLVGVCKCLRDKRVLNFKVKSLTKVKLLKF